MILKKIHFLTVRNRQRGNLAPAAFGHSPQKPPLARILTQRESEVNEREDARLPAKFAPSPRSK